MVNWKFSISLADVWHEVAENNTPEVRRKFVGVAVHRLKLLLAEIEKHRPIYAPDLKKIIDEFDILLKFPDDIEEYEINNLMDDLWDWADEDHIAFIDVMGLPDVPPGKVKIG